MKKILKNSEFLFIRDLINTRFGINFTHRDLKTIQSKLSNRITFLELNSFFEYCQYLQGPSSDHELLVLIDILTNNETYFFREEYHFNALKNKIFSQLKKANASKRNISIWSAGCSSGEELYSIAILINQSDLFKDWDILLWGSDISKKMLARARAGVYSEASFRNTHESIKEKYFTKKTSNYSLNSNIKKMCKFSRLNLLAEPGTSPGLYDAVFCRNVLMYFDKKAKEKTINLFYNLLTSGGYLFLGHTETLLNMDTAFETFYIDDSLIYRKKH